MSTELKVILHIIISQSSASATSGPVPCHVSPCSNQLFALQLERASVRFSSVAQSCLTLCYSMDCSMPGLLVHHQLPGAYSNSCSLSRWWHLTISSSVIPFSSPTSIFPSTRVFSNEWVLHIRWPKYWSFSFSISPSNEYSGLISFRIDWLDLLAVQGTLKRLLQHHSSKSSILQFSASFVVQLSHPYMTTAKTIALARWTFVGKVISLLFNMLFKLEWAYQNANLMMSFPRYKSLNVPDSLQNKIQVFIRA